MEPEPIDAGEIMRYRAREGMEGVLSATAWSIIAFAIVELTVVLTPFILFGRLIGAMDRLDVRRAYLMIFRLEFLE